MVNTAAEYTTGSSPSKSKKKKEKKKKGDKSDDDDAGGIQIGNAVDWLTGETPNNDATDEGLRQRGDSKITEDDNQNKSEDELINKNPWGQMQEEDYIDPEFREAELQMQEQMKISATRKIHENKAYLKKLYLCKVIIATIALAVVLFIMVWLRWMALTQRQKLLGGGKGIVADYKQVKIDNNQETPLRCCAVQTCACLSMCCGVLATCATLVIGVVIIEAPEVISKASLSTVACEQICTDFITVIIDKVLEFINDQFFPSLTWKDVKILNGFVKCCACSDICGTCADTCSQDSIDQCFSGCSNSSGDGTGDTDN